MVKRGSQKSSVPKEFIVYFLGSVGALGSSPIISHFYETSEDKLFGGLSVISATYGVAAVLSLIMLSIYKYRSEPTEKYQPF